jgi:alpha-glucosidase (family GH31 glycosyl hydrolase)
MVAPISRAGATSKEVYLPRGKWYDLWTGFTFEGPGTARVNASVELMPVLVREDSIIPRTPIPVAGQGGPLTTLALDVYPRQHASFEMYEDDGSSRGYSRGEFAITRYSADVEGSRVTITIGSPQGTFEGLHRDKSYTLRVHLPAEPFEVRVNNKVIPNGRDVKEAGTGAELWYFDSERSAAIVSLGASAESRQVTIQ